MKSRALPLVLLAALALATWGRIVLADRLADQGYFTKYFAIADRILSGDPPLDRIGDVSPAYLWLTVLFRTLHMGPHAIRNAQLIGLSLAALLCALAARRLAGWPAAIATAVLILANRAAFVVATELEPETLIFFLIALALAALIAWNKPWLAGLALGTAVVARPVALATVVLIALWLALRRKATEHDGTNGTDRTDGTNGTPAVAGHGQRTTENGQRHSKNGQRHSNRRALPAFLLAAMAPILAIIAVNRSLTAHAVIMAPGTVFYEAQNPLSTPAAGVMPRIIGDMNAASPEPDFLHVAYRIVAARATNQPIDARLSNRFWSGKAMAYMRNWPGDAIEQFAWKAILAVHHYDAYDLYTMKRKADELARWPAIPFGVAFVLACTALLLRQGRGALIPVALFAAATLVALIAFNVSARQRMALLAPVAVLGGVGVAELARLVRKSNGRPPVRPAIVLTAAIAATALLGIKGAPMREDDYNWWSSFHATALHEAAIAARNGGDARSAATYAATSSIFNPAEPPLVGPQTLRSVALSLLQTLDPDDEPRRFDIAIALEKAGAWHEANQLLRTLDHYHPRRENRAVSSVSYYRARAALHLNTPPQVVDALLTNASNEAPGDPHILALRTLRGDPVARNQLDATHDPFTRDWALAHAHTDLGDERSAKALLHSLTTRIPEWHRPRREL
ncbi:MAG TPA: hypothetical protein VGF69_05385 [Thermoanaerobaculia bacterium]|jgi:hypothetical protein